MGLIGKAACVLLALPVVTILPIAPSVGFISSSGNFTSVPRTTGTEAFNDSPTGWQNLSSKPAITAVLCVIHIWMERDETLAKAKGSDFDVPSNDGTLCGARHRDTQFQCKRSDFYQS
jgi:hypothetical protein